MDTAWTPWTDRPALTQERLMMVADIIRTARDAAADDHHPTKGETNWTLGVSAYERTCRALVEASQELPWLTIEAGAGGGPVQFVFSIGGCAVRFCHGEPDDLPSRYQQPVLPELLVQQQMSLLEGVQVSNRFLRFTISNDADGRPASIYLAEFDPDETEPVNVYLVPELSSTISIFQPTVPPANIPPVLAEADEDADQSSEEVTDQKKASADGN